MPIGVPNPPLPRLPVATASMRRMSETSRRTLLLPEPVAAALAVHRRAQAAEQLGLAH